ncbi:HD-GYP domain-containing protein [Motiliproteus sediminis]|uniref:HD-GYP domain-containing protein n=1 Tax=Motiliproteus sediminis TaxID=1468178 RepID=UPI001AEFADED|nr:HD domain-containing phosphohydrolase [Motiliproteus sediminis]
MSELDANVVDEYARHLSKVNARNQVLAAEDIYTEQGALLIKKGTPLSEELAERVIRHKLTRPLEHSVDLSNQIDSGRLLKAFEQLFERYPDCLAINQAIALDLSLREQCREYARYPLLMQKLTVMAMRRPHDYQKGIFCAWLSLALARQMKLDLESQNEAFLAGLMHDSGMLHIAAEILDKQGQLTTEEWRAIQSHPRIGELFLRQVPHLPAGVARATLEHHERRDGTGYPSARFAEELSTVGQVVAVADSLCAVRMLRFKSPGSNLANLLPILQLNARSYDQEAYRAAVSIIRSGELQQARMHSDDQMPSIIEQMLAAHQHLERCFESVAQLMEVLPEQPAAGRLRTASLQVQNSWFAVASSGLLSLSLKQLIERAAEEHELYAMADELHLMLGEVNWQFNQLRKVLTALHDDHALQGASAEVLQQGLEQMADLDQVVIH